MKRDGKNWHGHVQRWMLWVCATATIIINSVTFVYALSNRIFDKDIEAEREASVMAEIEISTEAAVKAEPVLQLESAVGIETDDSKAGAQIQKETADAGETELMDEQAAVLDIESIMSSTADICDSGKWAVSVMDLREGIIYDGCNEEEQVQSASVIKVFIMAAVYGRVCYPANEASAINVHEQYEGEIKELLTNMITVSDNNSANRLVELLGDGDFEKGKEVVNSFCQSEDYNGTHLGRRFMEENPQDDNYTTAADCRKILFDIYNGGCVCPEASGKMLELLQNQTIKTKISDGLPGSVLSANKTGEMPEGLGLGCIENDIAIVYGESRHYVICVLANDLGGRNEEAKKRIGEISRQVYKEIGE